MRDNKEIYFVEEIKIFQLKTPLEIINWYRNFYHNEDEDTERGIMARAINDFFMDMKNTFK